MQGKENQQRSLTAWAHQLCDRERKRKKKGGVLKKVEAGEARRGDLARKIEKNSTAG